MQIGPNDELCIPYHVFITTLESFGALRAQGEDKTFAHGGYTWTAWIYIDAMGRVKQVLVPNLKDNDPYPHLGCGEIAMNLGLSPQQFYAKVTACLAELKAKKESAKMKAKA